MTALQGLSPAEQSLLWDQGFVGPDHKKAEAIMSIAEALKASGYDFATILIIIKLIQGEDGLPSHFSIVNNRFIVIPAVRVYDLSQGAYLGSDEGAGIRKLMALTFWI
jgi:hypothetical protein